MEDKENLAIKQVGTNAYEQHICIPIYITKITVNNLSHLTSNYSVAN